MSYQACHNELRTRFRTQWGVTTTVDYPNAEFTIPAPNTTWCRFRIIDNDSNLLIGSQISFGAEQNFSRYFGHIIVQLFGPANKGDGALLALADQVLSIYNNWHGTYVKTRRGFAKAIGIDENGFYQINVVIPFKRDELI